MDVKLILIPIDFSNHCKLALNYAVSIAHKFGAKLELLHVVDTKSFYADEPTKLVHDCNSHEHCRKLAIGAPCLPYSRHRDLRDLVDSCECQLRRDGPWRRWRWLCPYAHNTR